MSSIDSSGAVRAGTIRRTVAVFLREHGPMDRHELESRLQQRFDVADYVVENQVDKLLDNGFLTIKNGEVTVP